MLVLRGQEEGPSQRPSPRNASAMLNYRACALRWTSRAPRPHECFACLSQHVCLAVSDHASHRLALWPECSAGRSLTTAQIKPKPCSLHYMHFLPRLAPASHAGYHGHVAASLCSFVVPKRGAGGAHPAASKGALSCSVWNSFRGAKVVAMVEGGFVVGACFRLGCNLLAKHYASGVKDGG